MAVHRRSHSGGEAPETGLLAGRNVVLGLRGLAKAEAVRDWLDWHRRFLGADGALVHTGAEQDDAEALATFVAPLGEDMEIVLVRDERATPEATGPIEELRWRFLAEAQAVALLSIADLMFQDRAGTPFDRAAFPAGEVLTLAGQRIYPLRLRQGKPALHGDHSAVVPGAGPDLGSWCVAPGQCPPDAIWDVGAVRGMPLSKTTPVRFGRAMGVAQPGTPVGKLVRRADLVESAELVELMTAAFGQRPPAAQLGKRALTQAAGMSQEVTVVTAMKDEGPFILDWIAHHRAVGVTRFLVYTNDCSDATDLLLDLLADAGVERRDNPFREAWGGPQHSAFRAADRERAVREAGWLLTLDVDEYLNIRAGEGRLADLFAALPDVGAISIPWRLFGNADIHGFRDLPVTRQFHLAAPEYAPRPMQAWAFKTLYRNDGTFGGLGVHRPKSLDPERARRLHWVDASGRMLPRQLWRNGWRMTGECWGYDLAAINHYALRSAESFLVKRERGRVNHVGQDQGIKYWFRMNQNVTEDRSIGRLEAAVSAERARLAALPGVALAHDTAVAWHRARIEVLQEDPAQAALFAKITGPRLQKLSRMVPNFGNGVFYLGPEVIPDEIVARNVSDRFYFNADGSPGG